MQAFPVNVYEGKWNDGMELRDYFAAKAMQGLVTTVKGEEWHAEETAEIAYFVADAMMKARKQGAENDE